MSNLQPSERSPRPRVSQRTLRRTLTVLLICLLCTAALVTGLAVSVTAQSQGSDDGEPTATDNETASDSEPGFGTVEPTGSGSEAGTGSSSNANSGGAESVPGSTNSTSDLQPDVTVRSFDQLQQAAESASAGANVYIPPDVTITASADEVTFDQRGLTLYSDGGNYGQGGGVIRLPKGSNGDTVQIAGRGSTVSGIRFIGPFPDYVHGETGDEPENANGIKVTAPGVTVQQVELAGFTHYGVQFEEVDSGLLTLSYGHHNTHPGLGYAISVNRANVSIKYNRFNANRHSIQTTRDTESSYYAEGNIQGPKRPNHAFDTHSGSRTDAAHGGRRIVIVNNTFLPPSSETDAAGDEMDDPAIEIDGRLGPVEGALVANNAFVGIERGRATIQNEEVGQESQPFATDADPSEFNNIRFTNNGFPSSRSAIPADIGAPDTLPGPSQIPGGGFGGVSGAGSGFGQRPNPIDPATIITAVGAFAATVGAIMLFVILLPIVALLWLLPD